MGAREPGTVQPKSAARLADPEFRHELTVAKAWGYRLDEWRALPDDDRDLLTSFERDVCPSCGNLRSTCSDPTIDWHPRTSVCYATAAVQWGQRRLQKKWGDKAAEDGASPLDGVAIYATDQAPEPSEDEFA
ncbi:hypothetical protein GUY44_11910 [Pimelobacter simplex]|uniref:hypothetical protein n=1 Tax=Nocardioides simplex TaxID=2045 RepID=UPI0011608EEF|nr:hypothetical protein [Pimelobacter simplex]MCG8151187.1 hypothetical protein [Pimelobacter simplex]GEB17220.1 hypothetical protein NSI01_55350 [Pimelobacter simplex]